MLAFIIFFVCCVNLSFGQYPLAANETCDTLSCPAVETTQQDRVGIWYLVRQIQVYKSSKSSCIYLNVTAVNETRLYKERVEIIDGVKYVSKSYTDVTGVLATTVYHDAVHNVTYQYQTRITNLTPDSFALISCNDCGYFSKDGAGIFGRIYHRLQNPPCDQIEAKLSSLTACGIPANLWEDIDHKDCFQKCPASSFSSAAPASVISSYVSSSASQQGPAGSRISPSVASVSNLIPVSIPNSIPVSIPSSIPVSIPNSIPASSPSSSIPRSRPSESRRRSD